MNVGIVGLGIMGAPMAMNLMKAGYQKLRVYNRSDRPRVDEVVKAGAVRCKSPEIMARDCDVIITMVTDSHDVEEVIMGEADHQALQPDRRLCEQHGHGRGADAGRGINPFGLVKRDSMLFVFCDLTTPNWRTLTFGEGARGKT